MGLKAIKTEGGITFAQDDTALYDSMPHHAAEMGYVDFILPPDKIAAELAALIQFPYSGVISPNEFFQQNKPELRKIHTIMHSKRNVDFSYYKQSTIYRRIMRRMLLNHLKNLGDYANLLRESNAEVNALYHDLLISVTDFFRDPALFQSLTNKILPALLKNRKSNDPVRIWVPGCATGEEAVSIAIVLLEYLGEQAITTPVQVFATDLNETAIERARAGIYSRSALQNISPQRLKKFFIKLNGDYQIVKAIRDICIFATHNLLGDPPFSRMDIISCQNVLIYLEAIPQNKIMHAFHYALKQEGYLLLGKSETIGSAVDLFDQVSKEYKIYTKKPVATPLQLDFSVKRHAAFRPGESEEKIVPVKNKEFDLEKETDRLLLSRYIPASVLVNKDLEILRFRGQMAHYLEPAGGKASLHLMKMLKEDIAFELRTAINAVKKEGRSVKKEGIHIMTNGTVKELSVEVVPLQNAKDPFYLIIFQENGIAIKANKINTADAGTQRQKDKRIILLEDQLKEARESMKIMNEEFEATREELQSANEEILSSNEELQSINEELETSKEELQSTNEELTTINEELHNRNAELKEASDYAEAILQIMHESLLLLNSELKVKKANKGFYKMFHVNPEKTEGAYLFDLGNKQWDIPELHRQLKMVQTKNIDFVNFEVTHDFESIGRKTMLLNAQRFQHKDSGEASILLTIQDITQRKEFEQKLKEREERFRVLIQNTYDIITIFDENGIIKYESPAIESILGYKPEQRVGKNIYHSSIVHPEDRQIKQGMLEKSLAHPGENVYAEFRLRHRDGSYKMIDAICRNMVNDPNIRGVIATYRDITTRKLLEQQKDEFVGIASHELKTPVTSLKAYSEILQDMFLNAKDKRSADLLHKMESQIDRLNMLIVDLLDFTRIEGGKLKFREEQYDMNGLIEEVTEEMQRLARTHTIVKKLDKTVKMWGDRYRTGQVLTNLINNALKYSPKSKKIIVSTQKTADGITVCVKDFGIGIRKDLVGKVFERFFRVTEPVLNTFPGLGLGLYIASEIIQRQGGNVWVKSTEGKGSTFCFSLPLKRKNQ